MTRRSDFRICEYCGAYLDVGEVCDCAKNTPKKEPAIKISKEGYTGQAQPLQSSKKMIHI